MILDYRQGSVDLGLVLCNRIMAKLAGHLYLLVCRKSCLFMVIGLGVLK